MQVLDWVEGSPSLAQAEEGSVWMPHVAKLRSLLQGESGLKHGDDIDDNSGVADCGDGDCDCEDVEIVLWIKEKGY